MTTLAVAVAAIAFWCLLAFPLAVVVGRAFNRGESRPGYLDHDAFRRFVSEKSEWQRDQAGVQ